MRRTAILPGVALAIGLSAPAVSAQPVVSAAANSAAAVCLRLVKQLKSDFADYRAARSDASRIAANGGGARVGGGRAGAQLSVGLRILGKGKTRSATEPTAFSTFRHKQMQTLAAMEQLAC